MRPIPSGSHHLVIGLGLAYVAGLVVLTLRCQASRMTLSGGLSGGVFCAHIFPAFLFLVVLRRYSTLRSSQGNQRFFHLASSSCPDVCTRGYM